MSEQVLGILPLARGFGAEGEAVDGFEVAAEAGEAVLGFGIPDAAAVSLDNLVLQPPLPSRDRVIRTKVTDTHRFLR